MECKVLKLYFHTRMATSIDLTRMECKDNPQERKWYYRLSIDLTRMECKGRYIWE